MSYLQYILIRLLHNSNCFYASKPCTYTDSNGRSVPAPRQDMNEGSAVQDRSRKKSRSEGEPSRLSPLPRFLPSTPVHDYPPRTELEPVLTRELTNCETLLSFPFLQIILY